MTLNSMTGFARSEGARGDANWHWEVRSVNGRGLDVRTRFPPGFELLEPRVREAIARKLSRGSVSVALGVRREAGIAEIHLNEGLLAQALAAVERIRASGDFERPRPDALLGLRGVLEMTERTESEADVEARLAAMVASLETAIAGVVDARATEGQRLEAVLLTHLASIDALVDKVERSPARSAETIRVRLKDQVARLLEATQALDETRLYQEAALLAQRADIDEELKRLSAHTAAARDLLAAGGPVGRKLDFLAQELNREANTLCAKSNDVDVTRLGLDLKATIDQLREQVQNIE